MDSSSVIEALAALAHENRLAIFRLLVRRGPEGLSAGTIAEGVGLTPSSLTFHVQQLTRAGLLTQRRDGRQLIYAADFGAMNALVDYLMENCCGSGSCASACAPPKKRTAKRKGTTARART